MKQSFQLSENPRPHRLRWVLHYASGIVKRGMWDDSLEGCPHTSAAMQKREGIILAQIEAMDLTTASTRVAAECDGHVYKMFQWVGAANMNMVANGGQGKVSQPVTLGLVLHDTKNITTVFKHGLIEVAEAPKEFDDSTFHYGR